MKTLVTGGAGFIGSNVVKLLLAQNEEVKVLHLPNERLDNLKGLDVELVAGNVLDQLNIDKAVESCNKVYHLAAMYAFWLPNPRLMFDVNVEGSRNVFKSCLRYKVEKIVYTSSLVRFGGQGLNKVCNEESNFKLGESGDKYSISKFESHKLAEHYANEKDLNLTIVCPALPIGPGDVGPTPTGKYLKYSLDAPALFYNQTVTNVADVRDIAKGHLLAMDKGKKGRSYILGGLDNISMRQFLELCLKVSSRKVPLIKLPNQIMRAIGLGMQLNSIFISRKAPLLTYESVLASEMGLAADCSRAINELGYSCRPLDQSIKDALNWFEEHA